MVLLLLLAGLGWAGCRGLVEGVCPGAPEGFILSPNLHSASHAVGVVVDWASAGVPMLVRRRSGRGSALDWASWRCLSAKTGITRTRSGGGVHGGGGGEGEVGHGANLGMGGEEGGGELPRAGLESGKSQHLAWVRMQSTKKGPARLH